MGRLVIAHHKSYHPYRRDNIERVRRDEEEARQKEAQQDGRAMLADSEARIDRLRERAGGGGGAKSGKKNRKDDPDPDAAVGGPVSLSLTTSRGHINFFEDLEHDAISTALRASKKPQIAESEKGVPLAPSTKDLRPWYSEKSSKEREEEIDDDRRRRDAARKSMDDPLTSITHQLASTSSASRPSSHTHRPQYRPLPAPSANHRPPDVNDRLARESSERQRALDLIRRKKREMSGSEPSTPRGHGYSNQYNRKDVEEAHRGRESKSNWNRERERWPDQGDFGYERSSRKRW